MKILNFTFQIDRIKKHYLPSLNSRGEGSIYTAAIVTVIIIGSSFLVGGLYPDLNRATTDGSKIYEPDDARADKKDTGVVQLRQLRVKKGKANRNNNNNNNNNNNQSNQDDSNRDQSTPPACENNGAIALLVDLSASMQNSDKMTKLKNALLSFSNGLTSSTYVGLYTFASPNVGEPDKEPKERISFGKFSKDAFDSAVDKFQPYIKPDGATYMRDGFTFVRSKLDQAKIDYPDKKFSLIIISDGVPEIIACDPSHMPGGVCKKGLDARNYDYTQDPTTLPNVADQVKNSGVTVYSVVIYDNSDLEFTNKLKEIMQNVASSSQNYHETLNGDELNSIFQQIQGNVCN